MILSIDITSNNIIEWMNDDGKFNEQLRENLLRNRRDKSIEM